jgi:hypothetical protein
MEGSIHNLHLPQAGNFTSLSVRDVETNLNLLVNYYDCKKGNA